MTYDDHEDDVLVSVRVLNEEMEHVLAASGSFHDFGNGDVENTVNMTTGP